MANSKSTLTILINASSAGAIAAVSKVKSSFASLRKSVGSLIPSFSRLSLLAVAGFVALGVAVVGLGAKMISLGADVQTSKMQFSTLLGDVNKGNKMFKELQEFANVTPFNTKNVVDSGQALLGYGVAAKEMKTTLSAIGNAASATGVDLKELSNVYGKAMSKGKVGSETIDQLAERKIPILDVLAQKYNTTAEGIRVMSAEGKIMSSDIKEAFISMSAEGGRFAGAMEKQSKSATGLWSTLIGKLTSMLGTLGDQVLPLVCDALEEAISFVDSFADSVNDGSIATSILEVVSVIVKSISVITQIVMRVVDVITGVVKIATGLIAGIGATFNLALVKMVEGALWMWNKLASMWGGEEKKVDSTWKKSSEDQLAWSAGMIKDGGSDIATGFSSNYESKLVNGIDAFADKIDTYALGLKNKIAEENKNAKNATYDDVVAQKNQITTDDKKIDLKNNQKEKGKEMLTNSLLTIGGYGLGGAMANPMDIKRNDLLKNILSTLKKEKDIQTVLA